MRILLAVLIVAFPNAVGGSFVAGWLPGVLTATLMLAVIAALATWLGRVQLLRRAAGRHLSYDRIHELEVELGYEPAGPWPPSAGVIDDLRHLARMH